MAGRDTGRLEAEGIVISTCLTLLPEFADLPALERVVSETRPRRVGGSTWLCRRTALLGQRSR